MRLPRRNAAPSAVPEEVDIEDRKQVGTLLAGQNGLIGMIASGTPLGETLDALCRLVEQMSPDWLASILLVDRGGERVWHGAAPSLPKTYVSAIDGVPAVVSYGPYGLAVAGQQVVVNDIAADSRWSSEYRDLGSEHGLHACWLTPIKASNDKVLGIFELYRRQQGEPHAKLKDGLEPFVHLAAIAIERAQAMPGDTAEEMLGALRRAEERRVRAITATQSGHTDWNLETGEFYVSPRLLEICGFAPSSTFRDRAEWIRRFPIHPDDRAKWESINTAHIAGQREHFRFEVRIVVRGETRWLAVSSVCEHDTSGRAIYWTSSKTDITERKQAELYLAEAQRLAHMGSWVFDVADFEYWSPELFKIHGLEPGARAPNVPEYLALLHHEDREFVAEEIRKMLANHSGFDFTKRIVRPDGAIRHVRYVAMPATTGGTRFVGTGMDVTEQEQLTQALRASEARFRSLTELSSDWFWEQDEDLRFSYLSNQADNLTGFTGQSSIGKTRWELEAISPMSGSWAEHKAVLEARQPFRDFEEFRVAPDGKVWYLSISGTPIFDEQGRFKGYQGTGRDITETKRIEEELRSRQQMLDLAQKSAGAVPWQWHYDVDPVSNRWSSDLEMLFGVPANSFDGTSAGWRKLIHPDDWLAVKAAIKRSHESGEIDVEYRVQQPDGSVRWLHQKGRTFLGGDGKPERSIGFMFDVTDKHKSEEDLVRLEKQLRLAQRLESMGTLAGGIAHDFNNILGAILGYGEMASRDAPKGSRLRRDLDSIMIAGERGRALIDRILAFSRSGLGEHVAVHVEKVVSESINLLAAKLPEGIRLDTKLSAGRAAILGDATQVHQVLMNLGTNAVQAMPSGGTLWVSLVAIHSEQRATTIGNVAAGEYVVLTVADTGIGIPRDIVDRIFDPFFTTKEVGTGTGLGLSLVHGIVSELGGAIDLRSTPGEGTEFTVYLPRYGDAPDSAESSETDNLPLPRGDGQRVLIVDDEEPLGRFAARALEELGYVPTPITSSTAALAAFLADPERYDALITDERMPGLSGIALIREVRGVRGTMPILLMTGYVGGTVARRARQAGANEVLKKPISARDLATSLARVLRR
jgi:PAS domain S-box-containing protein